MARNSHPVECRGRRAARKAPTAAKRAKARVKATKLGRVTRSPAGQAAAGPRAQEQPRPRAPHGGAAHPQASPPASRPAAPALPPRAGPRGHPGRPAVTARAACPGVGAARPPREPGGDCVRRVPRRVLQVLRVGQGQLSHCARSSRRSVGARGPVAPGPAKCAAEVADRSPSNSWQLPDSYLTGGPRLASPLSLRNAAEQRLGAHREASPLGPRTSGSRLPGAGGRPAATACASPAGARRGPRAAARGARSSAPDQNPRGRVTGRGVGAGPAYTSARYMGRAYPQYSLPIGFLYPTRSPGLSRGATTVIMVRLSRLGRAV